MELCQINTHGVSISYHLIFVVCFILVLFQNKSDLQINEKHNKKNHKKKSGKEEKTNKIDIKGLDDVNSTLSSLV